MLLTTSTLLYNLIANEWSEPRGEDHEAAAHKADAHI